MKQDNELVTRFGKKITVNVEFINGENTSQSKSEIKIFLGDQNQK
jgi:hypothetical protein